jgi:exosortase H (IPTLxxWG-CTERM-specific)
MAKTRQRRQFLRPAQLPAARASRPGRFLALFAACFLFGFAVLMMPPVRPAAIRFSGVLVAASGALIHLCGGSAQVQGTVLRDPSTGLAIEMKDGCNGIYVTLLLCSALLAFPSSWAYRAKGLLVGTAAIQAVNLLRFVSLFYLRQYNQGWFDFAHEYLWESLIMLDAFVVFWMWVQGVSRSVVMSCKAIPPMAIQNVCV